MTSGKYMKCVDWVLDGRCGDDVNSALKQMSEKDAYLVKSLSDENRFSVMTAVTYADHVNTNLQAEVERLSARVAELEAGQGGRCFFSYCPEGNDFETHASLDAARQAAQDSLDYYQGISGDGWSEEVFNIAYGVILGDAYVSSKRPMDESERESYGVEEGEVWDIQIADFKDQKGCQ